MATASRRQVEAKMGLDQRAWAVKGEAKIDIQYWRKHYDLEAFMEGLYRERGGFEEFNCIPIKLLEEDLLLLQNTQILLREAYRDPPDGETPYWVDRIKQTDDFIAHALALKREGYEIFYSSWW
jgi:hypothetical protein